MLTEGMDQWLSNYIKIKKGKWGSLLASFKRFICFTVDVQLYVIRKFYPVNTWLPTRFSRQMLSSCSLLSRSPPYEYHSQWVNEWVTIDEQRFICFLLLINTTWKSENFCENCYNKTSRKQGGLEDLKREERRCAFCHVWLQKYLAWFSTA